MYIHAEMFGYALGKPLLGVGFPKPGEYPKNAMFVWRN